MSKPRPRPEGIEMEWLEALEEELARLRRTLVQTELRLTEAHARLAELEHHEPGPHLVSGRVLMPPHRTRQ